MYIRDDLMSYSMNLVYFSVTLLVSVLAALAPAFKKNGLLIRLNIFLINVIMVVFSAFRIVTAKAVDEYAYRSRYLFYSSSSLLTVLRETSEPVFAAYIWVFSKLSNDTQTILIVTGALTVILFLYCIRRDAKSFGLGILLLMITTIMFSTFNGIQQYVASAVLMVGSKYVYKRDFKKYLLFVLFASLIHNSALFMIFVYFIAIEKPWQKRIWLMIGLTFILLIFFNQVMPTIIRFFEIYAKYAEVVETGHHGTNWINVLISVAPVFLVWVCYRYVDRKDNITATCINLSLVNAMVVALSTQEVFLARLSIYTLPYIVVLLARLLPDLRRTRLNRALPLMYFCIILGYSLLSFFRMQDSYYQNTLWNAIWH